MKKMFLLVTILLAVSTIYAQQAKPVWVTIKTPNLKCWECRERLDRYLIIENNTNMDGGLAQWKFNLLQGEIKFQYLPDRINPDIIRTTLNNAGFDADTEKAEPDAYKMLPPICKRAEDGGGPQKNKPCHMQPYN
ncbi:MAG: hypothetical protein Q8L07_06500 [Sediminibacterium sp.]|nr:hypothetical protein [Sediminibacterium sp.]